jgi:hypothetical protein
MATPMVMPMPVMGMDPQMMMNPFMGFQASKKWAVPLRKGRFTQNHQKQDKELT